MHDEGLYTIGNVSKLTGVAIRTIRYYSLIGLLPPAQTTDAGYRLYTARDIWRLQVIRTLRSFDFGLEDVAKMLAGDVSIGTAIALQRDVVSTQIAHLMGIQNILEHAQADIDNAGDALRFLHELGAALDETATERRRILIDKLRAATVSNEPDLTEWQEQFLQKIAEQLPETMLAEQAAVWAELVTLVNDATFATALRNQTEPFEATVQQPGVDEAPWQQQMQEINERALVAYQAGAAPASDEVQAIVSDWIAYFAVALQQPNTPAFAGWVAEHAAQLMPEEIGRFWDLMGRLNGCNTEPAWVPVQRLLIAGTQWRAAQHTHESAASY